MRDRAGAAAIVLAGLIAGSCSNPLARQYEYEEQLYLNVDGSATIVVNRITGSSGTYNAGSSRNGTYSRNSQGTPRDGVCVYELPNYQGRWECWNQGQSIASLARQDNATSQVSSIRLFGRAIAVVYQGANYQGESMTVDRDIPDLAEVAVRNNRGNARGQGQQNSNGRSRANARGTTWDQHIASIHVQEQR